MDGMNIVLVAVGACILYVLVDGIVGTLTKLYRTKRNAKNLVSGYIRIVGVRNLLKLWWLQVKNEIGSHLGRHGTYGLSKLWFTDVKDVLAVHNVMSSKCKLPKAKFCPAIKLEEEHPVVDCYKWCKAFHVKFVDGTNALIFIPWTSRNGSGFRPVMILRDHDIDENKIVDAFIAQAQRSYL